MMIIHGCPADFQTWYSLKLAMIRSIPEPPWFGAFFSRWHCNYCLHWRRRFPGSRECAFDLCWVPQHTSVGWGDVQVPVAKMVWHGLAYLLHLPHMQIAMKLFPLTQDNTVRISLFRGGPRNHCNNARAAICTWLVFIPCSTRTWPDCQAALKSWRVEQYYVWWTVNRSAQGQNRRIQRHSHLRAAEQPVGNDAAVKL